MQPKESSSNGNADLTAWSRRPVTWFGAELPWIGSDGVKHPSQWWTDARMIRLSLYLGEARSQVRWICHSDERLAQEVEHRVRARLAAKRVTMGPNALSEILRGHSIPLDERGCEMQAAWLLRAKRIRDNLCRIHPGCGWDALVDHVMGDPRTIAWLIRQGTLKDPAGAGLVAPGYVPRKSDAERDAQAEAFADHCACPQTQSDG
jgi:hypothetical protein